jgi:CheY-like chemotaxis protein
MPQPPHVLIVEDDDDVRALLTRLLRHLYRGATIAQAINGVAALCAVQEQRPDLIITDYQMPIMDGLELVHALRAQGARVSILMLSSDPRASDAVLKAGADAFLLKPFQLRQFTQQLYALMSACS